MKRTSGLGHKKGKIGNSGSNFHFRVRVMVGKSFAKGSHFATRLRL